MSQPRMCVGCRRSDIRSNLVRIACVDSTAVIDTKAVLPGRGAWIHSEDRCLERAITSRGFDRAFKMKDVDTSSLSDMRINVSNM